MILKETMLYYVTHHSYVYCTILTLRRLLIKSKIARTMSAACCAQSFVVYVHTRYCSSLVERLFVQAFLF